MSGTDSSPAPESDGPARPSRRRAWRAWATWLSVLAATALLLLGVRARLDEAHVVLAFVIVVLGGSAAAGRALGLTLAFLAFLLLNFAFLPPYYTLAIADRLDWIVLGAFLTTSIVGAQLLTRAQQRAEEARQRAVEVERLAALGAETLSVGRAEEALDRIVEVVRSALGLDCCEILVPRDGSSSWNDTGDAVLVSAARAGECARAEPGGVADPAAGIARVPLAVRGRPVGVLRLAAPTPLQLDAAQRQFLNALAYYAALGVERVRLAAEVERAEALRQADLLRNALLAGVSHDLRTPLTTIKALASGLRQAGSPEAASIEDEADRLNRLVADLLDLSRLNAGAMPLRLELNAAEDLVGAALDRVSGAVGDRRVIVVSDPAAGGAERPALLGRFDFVQSLRALANLLENAAKYAPPDDSIELTVERRDARLHFRVADRGPGVADTERDRIFEPFYRAPGARPDVGGAGLGLAIARRLAAEQGGDVQYEPRPGGGSVFTLSLPAADPESAAPDFTRS